MENRSIYQLENESIQYFSQYLWEKNEKKRDEYNFHLLNGPCVLTNEGKTYYYDRLKIRKSNLQKNIYIFTYQMTYEKEGIPKELTYIVNTQLFTMNSFSFIFHLLFLIFCFIFS